MSGLEEQVAQLVAEGWVIVGHGNVLIPFESKTPKPTFAERVEGFVGAAPGDRLLDDDRQWFQLAVRSGSVPPLAADSRA